MLSADRGPQVRKLAQKRRSKLLRLLDIQTPDLLDGNRTLHAESKMWRAVERVLAWLDVSERDRNGLARIHLHVARKLAHFVGPHIGIELRLHVGRDRSRIECDVVRAATHDHELDGVSLLDS